MKRVLLLAAACGAKAAPAPGPARAPAHACDGVTVDEKAAPGTTFPGWLSAWHALAHPPGGDVLIPDGTPPPTDDASAKALLCGDAGCPDTGPWIVGAGMPGDRIQFSLAMPAREGLVVFPALAVGAGGNCPYQDDIDTTPGKYFEVVVAHNSLDGPDCAWTTDRVDYAWFDPTTQTRVLAITAHAGETVTATADRVHVSTGTCSEDHCIAMCR